MASKRQILANHRNAQRSTGPASPEGKARSRMNSLKHGLAGEGVVLTATAEELLDERIEQWRPLYLVSDVRDEFYLRTMVAATIQMEQARNEEMSVRNGAAMRAVDQWDRDRTREALAIAGRLAKDPERVVADLMASVHGCEWLIERWKGLAAMLEEAGEWNDAQNALALDLLGVPEVFRIEGAKAAVDETPAELAARQIVEIEEVRDSLVDIDEHRREMVGAGFDPEPSPEIRRLRRYEFAAERRFRWAQSRLTPREAVDAEAPAPSPVAEPAPPRPPSPPPGPPTEDDYKAAERAFWQAALTDDAPNFLDVLNRLASSPASAPTAAPAPATSPRPLPAFEPSPGPNRHQRRAAEKHARRGR